MRKTIIVVAMGAALALAACTPGTETESLSIESLPVESMAPLESEGAESMDPLASPSDALESPASS